VRTELNWTRIEKEIETRCFSIFMEVAISQIFPLKLRKQKYENCFVGKMVLRKNSFSFKIHLKGHWVDSRQFE